MSRGGKREGAGRKPGWQLRRSAADLIKDLEEKHPGWSPLHLLAEVATNEDLDIAIRVDAAKAAAPFLHPRPRPVEMEPDAVVELEGRLYKARLMAAADLVDDNPGLADRLLRAHAAFNAGPVTSITVTTGVPRAPDEPAYQTIDADHDDDQPASEPATVAAAARPAAPVSAPAASKPLPAYTPISPRPEPIPFSSRDLNLPDYNPYEKD